MTMSLMDDGTECHGVPSDPGICDMVQGKPAPDQEEEAAEPPTPRTSPYYNPGQRNTTHSKKIPGAQQSTV